MPARLSFRPRSRQQAGAGRGARDASGPGEPDHLQRLQGRALHPDRAARPQARQEGHHRRREARGAGADDSGGQGSRRRADDRHPRAP